MNRESVELGFILKQIKNYDFSMDEFDDRLKLQKTIYLLQSYGVYLGYDFSWYLYGPYCSLLARAGFDLCEIYDLIPDDVKFTDRKDKDNFTKFLNFINSKDVYELEVAASLHYLKTGGKNYTDQHIIEKVVKKLKNRKNFTFQQVENIWNEMKKHNLIQ